MLEKFKGTVDTEHRDSDWLVLERYAKDERRRVDTIKAEMHNPGQYEIGGLSYREQLEKVSSPGALRKIGRIVLDVMDIHPRSSERRRQQEAFAIAKEEIDAERKERNFRYEMDFLASQTGDNVWQIMREEEQEKREQEQLAREIIGGMDVQRYDKQKRYENERKQEFLERDLNEKLVTVDELDEQVEANNPEVTKRYMEYEEGQVPIYDLKGLPFAMLSHSIEYRKANYHDEHHMGVQTSKQLVANPEMWRQRDDEFEMVKSGGQARGDVISASYINSEHNLNTRCYKTGHEPDICYGFEQVEGDAILAIGMSDMGSTNGFGKMRGVTNNLFDWNVLEAMPTAWNGYNEVVLRRYDETGKPRLPDYIIAQNGEITEGMLRHASAFNVPVVNIEEKFYNEKFRVRAEEILADVTEEDDYRKVLVAFHEIGSFSPYRFTMARINQTTLNKDLDVVREVLRRDYSGDLDQRLIKLGDLELHKRIPFIADVLRKEIKKIQKATEQREYYNSNVDGFEFFSAMKFDGEGYANPVEAEHLSFNMRLEGDGTNVETSIYRDDGMNGEAYTLLAPLVEAYGVAKQDNFRVSSKSGR